MGESGARQAQLPQDRHGRGIPLACERAQSGKRRDAGRADKEVGEKRGDEGSEETGKAKDEPPHPLTPCRISSTTSAKSGLAQGQRRPGMSMRGRAAMKFRRARWRAARALTDS